MDLATLLKITADTGGSDLHLSAGSPPRIRVNGRLQSLDLPDLTCDVVASLVSSILTDAQQAKLEQSRELDIAFNHGDAGRIRANLFHQKGGIGAAFRLLPKKIPSLEELRLPPIVAALAERSRGLVLVTGATGSGKSTTLAAMLDRINEARPVHILTLEDPIEYLHGHKTALVNQRELAADTHDLPSALRAALREDPDVVLVGEMRDLETMRAAMQLAETGHLTLATLHTNSAAQTITRIIDAFPAHQQAQIRTQLSLVLEGMVCQALVPAANATRRVAAVEVLIATPAIRSLIRDDKIHQIYGMMQAGQDKLGMQTMNQALARLVEERVISWDVALSVSPSRDELVSLVAGRLARRVS